MLPYGSPVIRHLAYHIWPLAENETWRKNLDQLIPRMSLFNGRRRIGIAVSSDGKTDPPEAVQEYLKDFDCEYVTVENRNRLGEVRTFLPLLEPLASTAPNEIVYRAHAKGVRHGQYDPAHQVHRWTKLSYDALFDYPELVEAQLLDHAFTGVFRRIGMFRTMGKERSHYSGTFYAFRSAFVFSKPNWSSIRTKYYGCESWPGQHWTAAEHACLFGDGAGNLYRENELKPWEDEFEKWRIEHQSQLRRPNVWCLGFPRCGTTSLCEALRILGWNPVHNPRAWDEVDAHNSAANGLVFAFWRDLAKLQPDAKFILNTRPIDDWLRSLKSVDGFFSSTKILDKLALPVAFGTDDRTDVGAIRAAWERHHQEVRATIPPNRLLVIEQPFEWNELCRFLNVPVPDAQFPWMNRS